MDLNVGNPVNAYGSMNDYIEVQAIYDPASAYPITTAAFDAQQELYWTGNAEGRVASYYGTQMSKYTSFRVAAEPEGEIRMLHANNNDIFVLTHNTLSSYSRLGVNNFKHKEVSFKNLQCLFFNQQERFFIGGYNELIYDFDIERLRVLRQLTIGDEQKDCIIIKSTTTPPNAAGSGMGVTRNGVLCTGSTNGQIYARDPSTLKTIHKFHPHNGSLSDFDINGNYLVSCGFSATRAGNLCVDRFLMIYDLRMMRAMSPVQLLIEPCFLHYLPMCSSVVAVATQSACFQMCDTNQMTPSTFYQAQVPPIGLATTFSMSSNCQAAMFGHSSGSMHLFTKGGENSYFNDFSDISLFIDSPQFDGNVFIDINDETTSLSNVPMPLTGDKKLISDAPKSMLNFHYRPTQPISQELLSNARIIHGIMTVTNKLQLNRNQVNNETYHNYLRELHANANKTSLRLDEMIEPAKEDESTNEATSANSENGQKLNDDDDESKISKEIEGEEKKNENEKQQEQSEIKKESRESSPVVAEKQQEAVVEANSNSDANNKVAAEVQS